MGSSACAQVLWLRSSNVNTSVLRHVRAKEKGRFLFPILSNKGRNIAIFIGEWRVTMVTLVCLLSKWQEKYRNGARFLIDSPLLGPVQREVRTEPLAAAEWVAKKVGRMTANETIPFLGISHGSPQFIKQDALKLNKVKLTRERR